MISLYEACRPPNHELLQEIIPPPQTPVDDDTLARALDNLYACGIRPDWWKLPPQPPTVAWDRIARVIEAHDPLRRSILAPPHDWAADRLLRPTALLRLCATMVSRGSIVRHYIYDIEVCVLVNIWMRCLLRWRIWAKEKTGREPGLLPGGWRLLTFFLLLSMGRHNHA